MASIHTSSVLSQFLFIAFIDYLTCRAIFVTHALFELALLAPEQVDEVRAEVTAAIEAEGGVLNKAAVGKFHKLDSLLKEIGRWHPLFASRCSHCPSHSYLSYMNLQVGMSRVILKDALISDGSVIPQGSVVAIAPKATHYNAEIYDQPEVFDPFRFSKMRQSGGIEGKQAFTALSNEYLLFGVG